MFPFHSADPTTQAILDVILAVIKLIFAANAPFPTDPESIGFLQTVLDLREFAGTTWQTATGMAQDFAIAIDNLVDAALRVAGFDPQAVLGDH